MRHASISAFVYGRTAFIAAAVISVAGSGAAAPTGAPVRHARIVDRPEPRPLDTSAESPRTWSAQLGAIHVKNRNTNAQGTIRLYGEDGRVDEGALREFIRVCSAEGQYEPLDPRLVQLAFRAAYHFKASSMIIVSATRRGTHGKHGTGSALDFQLGGVSAGVLAAHARTYPRAGVGLYTHPKTQYIHLDVREHSYHWLDGSPPGVTWRERLLPDPSQQKRDASWVRAMDLPEAAGG
jgi:uncharacterized protein YcbK (DUF882 family)